MHFGRYPLAGAVGAILAHSVRAGDLVFRKGRLLSKDDVAALAAAGITELTIAWLEAGDVGEDPAAARIAQAIAGTHVRIGAPFTGRANLYAMAAGLALVDTAKVDALNACDESITLASIAPFSPVVPRQMLGTVKIIPFAALETSVATVAALAKDAITVAPFLPRRAALISTSLPDTKPMLLDKNRAALEARLTPLGSTIGFERRVAHDNNALAAAIREAADSGADPILIFGASAIADRCDVIPAAIEQALGSVTLFGMPVDPGNLLLLGTLDGKTLVGLPGCARSPKRNGFDFVLWRLLAGLPVGRAEIAAMGVGGLLNEIAMRPQPRDSDVPRSGPQMPRIGAVILAAGQSARWKAASQDSGTDGANKLLQTIDGKPMIRMVVETALASDVGPVVVVTGNDAAEIHAALSGLPITICNNDDYSNGLSTSLIRGVNALPDTCDGALILLGDMPGLEPALLDRMVAAFDPSDDRAIIVPVHKGARGNPVLWASRFFPDLRMLTGDAGARALLAGNVDTIWEIEAGGDAVLTDIDTPEALIAWRGRPPQTETQAEATIS